MEEPQPALQPDPHHICPFCGWHPVSDYASVRASSYNQHLVKCRDATQSDRDYFVSHGKWRQHKPRVPITPVAPFQPTKSHLHAAVVQISAYVRTGLGEDLHFGKATEAEAVQDLGARVARRMLEGGHAAAFLILGGVEPVLPGQTQGHVLSVGKGGHWERVLKTNRPTGGAKPRSRRENAELWMEETRLAQDRMRCVEDSVLLTLRAHVGKWVTEDELFRTPNATSPEVMTALRTLQSYGLAESRGMLWRPLL